MRMCVPFSSPGCSEVGGRAEQWIQWQVHYVSSNRRRVFLIIQKLLVTSIQEELETLKKEQISAEMQMVEVLDELLQSFERSYSELVEGSKQLIMSFFTTARDLEGTFHAQLVVVGQKLYDEKYGIEVCSCSIRNTDRR